MSVKKLLQILYPNQKPWQMFMVFLGCLIGLSFILFSIQSFFDFNKIIGDESQGIGSHYLVINKKVSVANTLKLNNSSFDEAELEEISNLSSVKKISTFLPNQFQAQAYLEFSEGNQTASLKTDLFLESVDDSFVDIDLREWDWQPNSDEIPVILPNDFINLYNFTYAPARGLPQLSRNTISKFKFNIIIETENSTKAFTGRIIGFSDRITSMIVPMSFMQYANKTYSDPGIDYDVYRVIAEVKPDGMSSFYQYLKSNDLEANNELLKSGKLTGLIYAMFSILFLLGAIIIANAFTGFILYFQLMIYRSKYEIENLLRLGFSHNRMLKNYIITVSLVLFLLFIVTMLMLTSYQSSVSGYMQNFGFNMSNQISINTVLFGAGLVSLLAFLFSLVMRNEIKKIALPGK